MDHQSVFSLAARKLRLTSQVRESEGEMSTEGKKGTLRGVYGGNERHGGSYTRNWGTLTLAPVTSSYLHREGMCIKRLKLDSGLGVRSCGRGARHRSGTLTGYGGDRDGQILLEARVASLEMRLVVRKHKGREEDTIHKRKSGSH